MKLQLLEPDLQSIIQRIDNGDIDLNPNFQRGDVWDIRYQRRLIDSILRGWNIPPVHVVTNPSTECWEVLDGQQRLRSIWRFASSKFTVDGTIEAKCSIIQDLDGMYYGQLPEKILRRFNNFSIRVVIISEHTPAETSELFFRLNQPLSLSAAEHRNAYFGTTRDSIKKIVDKMPDYGLTKEKLAFSNTRLAYDDLVARLCETIEEGDLAKNISSNVITKRYKLNYHYSPETLSTATESLMQVGAAIQHVSAVRLSKGALLSWLFLVARAVMHSEVFDSKELGRAISRIETTRKSKEQSYSLLPVSSYSSSLLSVYNSKLSSQIAHPKSLLVRDVILWMVLEEEFPELFLKLPKANHNLFKVIINQIEKMPIKAVSELDQYLTDFILESSWGEF